MQAVLATFMEAAMLEYDITPISQKDIHEVYGLFKYEVKDPKLLVNIKSHIRHELAYKMVVGGKIEAAMLAKKFKTHYSLSYYIIAPQRRKKMPSLFFFLFCVKKMQALPIYVKANKNLKDYERYFEHTGDGIYKFKGLREDASWAELLRR